MKIRQLAMVALFGSLAALLGCDGNGGGSGGSGGSGGTGGGRGGTGGGTGGTGSGTLKWWTTCGDPSCGMSTDDPALTDCTTEMAGAPCSMDGASCEIAGDMCNMNLVCATTDPKGDPNNCPESIASAKHDISYLSDKERERIRGELVSMPLATWKYNTEGRGEKEHLGFIIDDQPPSSPAVRPSGERVDLYGYTSMAVAAIQAQDRQIEALRKEVESLKEELRRSRSASGVCEAP
jgi:hypothetical protein